MTRSIRYSPPPVFHRLASRRSFLRGGNGNIRRRRCGISSLPLRIGHNKGTVGPLHVEPQRLTASVTRLASLLSPSEAL